MRYTLALPFLAIGALAATPVRRVPDMVRRDLATITSVVANIASKIEAFDTAVKGDPSGLQSASDAVLSATKDGVTAISATSEITLTDALQLQSLIQDLTDKTQTAVNDAIAKKDAFVAAGLGAALEQGFIDQKAAAATLATTITSKVPEAVRELAATLSQGIQDALQKGIDAYKGTGGASSSAPPASSTPAESTPASSTPAESTPASSTPAESTPASSTPGGYETASSTPVGLPTTSAAPTGYPTKATASTGLPTYSSPTLSSSPPPFTGAAMPTAAAGYGVAAVAALVAAAAL